MSEERKTFTPEYINACHHEAIQNLKPRLEHADLVRLDGITKLASEIPNVNEIRGKLIWLPTQSQLHFMLHERVANPDKIVLRPCAEGWECTATISEWASDYGTFIDAQRRFVGADTKSVLLAALKATLGIGERLMV
jgi:hypothetical protein